MELFDFFHFPDVTVRRILQEDLRETVALINHAYEYQEKVTHEPRINLEKLQAKAQQSGFYIAKKDKTISGCVYIRAKDDVLHFGLLAVVDAQKGTGLAPALIAAVEAYARCSKCKSIQLDYMSIAPWLKKYYERYGFQETNEVENWGAIDLIRMTKKLV